MMNKLMMGCLILVMMTVGVGQSFAQDNAEVGPTLVTATTPVSAPKIPHLFVTSKLVGKYLASNGSVFHADPCQQGFIGAQLGDVYLETWFSHSSTGGFGNEFDFTAEWAAIKPSKEFPAKVTIGMLYIRANVTSESGMAADMLQPSIKFASGDVYIKAKYIFAPNGSRNPEPGAFLETGYAHVFPIGKRIGVEAKVTLEHDFQGAFGFNSGTIGQIKPTVLVHMTEFADMFGSYTYSHVWGDPLRGTESVWSGGLTLVF